MTFFKITLRDLIKNEPSRRSAKEAADYILALIPKYSVIELDLENVNLTPSIADEIFGKIAAHLGADEFKKTIKIMNASITQMTLIKHVIARRIS